MVIFNGYRDDTLFAVRSGDDGHPIEVGQELTNIAYAVRSAICDHLVFKEYRADEELYTVSLYRFSKTPEQWKAVKGATLKRTGDGCAVIMRGSTTAGFAEWRDETTFAAPAVDMILLDEVFMKD